MVSRCQAFLRDEVAAKFPLEVKRSILVHFLDLLRGLSTSGLSAAGAAGGQALAAAGPSSQAQARAVVALQALVIPMLAAIAEDPIDGGGGGGGTFREGSGGGGVKGLASVVDAQMVTQLMKHAFDPNALER